MQAAWGSASRSLIYLVICAITTKAENLKTAPKTPSDVLRENDAAVALILSDGDSSVSLGTGFFIADGTALVTNFHVITGAKIIYVKMGNGQISQTETVYAYDEKQDLAILKTHLVSPKVVTLGDSAKVSVGESVVVVSNPEGLEKTVTNGLVSGIRTFEEQQLFQISAPISHGSSGGPVFDETGRVIGVVVSFLSDGQNLNFAVPVNLVSNLWNNRRETSLVSLPVRQPTKAQSELSSNVDGSWSAIFADSIASGQMAFTLVQEGISVRGSYTSSLGGGGTIAGSLEHGILSFQLTQSVAGCPGTYTGTSNLRSNSMTGTYTGADCQGVHYNGTFTMSKGTSGNLSVPMAPAPASQPEPMVQYGSSSELRGTRKVFIYDVEPDVRSNMLKEFAKHPELTMVGDAREADVILMFGGQTFSMGTFTNVWSDTNGNGWATTTPRYGVTGQGSALMLIPPNIVRVVWQFSATRTTAFQRRPSTNFVRNFVSEWEKANK